MSKTRLSKREYVQSLEIAANGYDFYGIVAAAMREADNKNLERLRIAFPGVYESLLNWKGKKVWPLESES